MIERGRCLPIGLFKFPVFVLGNHELVRMANDHPVVKRRHWRGKFLFQVPVENDAKTDARLVVRQIIGMENRVQVAVGMLQKICGVVKPLLAPFGQNGLDPVLVVGTAFR